MQDKKITVYLAGMISNDPLYRMKFYDAARVLEAAGFTVLSPAVLPDGFTYEAYIRMSTAMLDECEAVCFLPDWTQSKGAMYEHGRAAAHDQSIFYYAEWLADQKMQAAPAGEAVDNGE